MRKFLPIAYLLTLLTGCATSNQVSSTARSSIEERLLISSFEQALAKLDTQEFKGKTVTVDGMYLRIIVHANEHMGQLIAYARMSGVVPPWSKKE